MTIVFYVLKNVEPNFVVTEENRSDVGKRIFQAQVVRRFGRQNDGRRGGHGQQTLERRAHGLQAGHGLRTAGQYWREDPVSLVYNMLMWMLAFTAVLSEYQQFEWILKIYQRSPWNVNTRNDYRRVLTFTIEVSWMLEFWVS